MQQGEWLKYLSFWAVMLTVFCRPAFAVNWINRCGGGLLAVVGGTGRNGERKTGFRLVYTIGTSGRRRLEALRVVDPHQQVDLAHPFEVALNDSGARERLVFVEQSLQKRGVKKKVYISDREVRIVSSDENLAEFSDGEIAGRAPVIVVLTKQVDEDINGTIHGAISELYLGELEMADASFRENTKKSVDHIVALALQQSQFQNRDVAALKHQCKRILFLRTVWLAKQLFYDANSAIRPAYAAKWSSDRLDKIKTDQQIEFYAHAEHDPIDANFARFVLPLETPGMELPFFNPPPLAN